MTSRTLKLLTASTAFVAAAGVGSVANAAVTTISASTAIPVQTSGTTGLNVAGTATISTTAGPAIEISGTGAMPINISTGAVISSNAVTGTIATQGNSGITGITINNSGTIVNLGGAAAISATAAQADGTAIGLTVRNTGTISGTVTSGAGALTYSATNGTQKGSIASTNSADTDSVTLTNSTMTGDITLGNGINNLIVSNSTLTGAYTGGSGVDTVTLTNATVTGLLDGSTGSSDVLTINGTKAFTNTGGIAGFETVNLNTDVTLANGGGLSGANAITLAAAKTLTVNNSFATAGGGTFTNNGTVNIAAGKTVTADTFTVGAGSKLGIAISDSTSAGQLIVANGITATSLTINMGDNVGYITSGTTFKVVDSTGSANALPVLGVTQTGVYRFSTALNNGDISLTIGRIATAAAVTGEDNKTVANVLDSISSSTNTQLVAVQTAISKQTTAAGVEQVVESLTPSIDGAGMASVNVTVDTGNQISNRLASLRPTSGIATGDAMASKHMWMQAFGSNVSQDDRNGASGYDANSGGVSLGLDTDTMVDGMTTGLAFSYGRASVDSNSSSNASTDIDSYVGTLYGSRVLDGGLFINGQVGLGYNKYDMTRTIIGVGQAKGDTNGWQGTAKAEAGKDFAAGDFTLTPLASLQYTYLNMDSYTETGAGGANLKVNPQDLSTVDAGVGGQVAYAIPLTDGGTLKPSAHAKYIYRMGDTEMGTTSSFTGAGGSFNTTGVQADRSSVNLGAGLLLTTVGGTDLSLNYDADIRSNLTGHTGQVKARWAF